VRHRIWLALAGALEFWIPLVLLEVTSKNGNFNLILANTLPLITVACVYWLMQKRHPGDQRALSVAMLIGIYVLGPVMMWLTWSAHGGGFATARGPHAILWLLLFTVVPPFTLYLATWNGTLVAVLAATVALAALAMPRGLRS